VKVNCTAALLFSLLIAGSCLAHVGSPDVYFQGDAGPYRLVVAILTPQMIPGVAEIQIRSSAPGVQRIKIVPVYIMGEGSKYPPPPDVLTPSKGDPQFFSGKLWLMASGSWEVRIEAEGDKGSGTIAVPVPAAARNTLPMEKGLGAMLLGLMALLVAAIVSIVGAARREGQLEPGVPTGFVQKRGARIVMAIAFFVVAGILTLGGFWWKSAAASLSNRMIYKPPQLIVSLLPEGKMSLRIAESAWHTRRPDTVSTRLIPDHGHLMHLFLIRMPQMGRFYHLHPSQDQGGVFLDDLPAIAAGHYQIFADIVRESGFPDTLIAEVNVDADIPDTPAHTLTGDDSAVSPPALTLTASSADSGGNLISPLADGSRMIWERDPGSLPSNKLTWFHFRVEDANGKPVENLEPYMGMAGHAEFVRSDFSVFAHVHPDGSAPMAAVSLAQESLNKSSGANSSDANPMPGMAMPGMATQSKSSEVSFPYGFPKPGVYRIFVQVKRSGQILTGIFDARVN
jgi:hypothetical protein